MQTYARQFVTHQSISIHTISLNQSQDTIKDTHRLDETFFKRTIRTSKQAISEQKASLMKS